MKEVFINGLGMVNAQFVDSITDEVIPLTENITKAQSPSLKEMISPAMSRRMAPVVKIGLYAALKSLEEAKVEFPDSIITGTLNGCLADSEKFLTAIIQNKEEFLTPTAFIQSTHNTVASQIALHLKCNAYNFTYTNGFSSFENALFDGFLQIENEESKTSLVGGIDEIGPRVYELNQLIGEIKSDTNNGSLYSEGAHFFLLSAEKSDKSYAKVIDVKICNQFSIKDLKDKIDSFLEQNQLNLTNIDAIISGLDNLDFMDDFVIFSYKHLIGEYGTSSAFGLTMGCELLKKQSLPNIFKANEVEQNNFENVLLINGHHQQDLSLVLIQKI